MTENHLLAGCLAGICEHTIMYPVDAIKTRIQIFGVYNMSSLYRGLSSVLLGVGPSHALYFATYEQIKKKFRDHYFYAAYAGTCASLVQEAVNNPFDVVKQRMQSFPKYTSVFQCFKTIYLKEGLKSFYVSYPASIAISIPFHSIHFTVYETLSEYLNPEKQNRPAVHMLCGGIAGGVAAALTTPLDVAKTFLQTRGDLNLTTPTIKHIYQSFGVRGFLRGIVPRVLSNLPASGICWMVYEHLKLY